MAEIGIVEIVTRSKYEADMLKLETKIQILEDKIRELEEVVYK
jgi:exonuclease VII small subunit